jgi:putative Mn2+ efflux pump MntP
VNYIEIILIAVSLAADAFAVAICKGLSMKKLDIKKATIVGLYFGIFQGLMPIIGYLLGTTFKDLITSIDHWIAFVLLCSIGANMIRESFTKDEDTCNDKIDFKTMLPLSIATSIDALAIGITFAFLKTNIIISSIIITITTLILSILGVILGNKFGTKYKNKAEFLGGFILIIMGIKILLEHLNIL